MKTNKIYFMYEPYPMKKIVVNELNFGKIHFLKNFIIQSGKVSLLRKEGIRVPIQSVLREEVKKHDLDFSKLMPGSNKFVEEKKLPSISRKETPKKLRKLSRLEERTASTSRIIKRGKELYYTPLRKIRFKKYGIIDSLIVDKGISKITCLDNELYVDYKEHKNISTGLKFRSQREVNNLIKKFSKQSGRKVSEKEPILHSDLKEGFKVYANFGTSYIHASFTLIRKN